MRDASGMMRLLALLCGLLLVVVGVELAFRPDGDVAAEQQVRGSKSEPHQVAGHDGSSGRALDHWVDVVLERPLFAPDRKPVGGVVVADAGLPRLTGIIASSDEAIAIFQPASGGKPVVARDGEVVGGWQVTAISADGVGLQKANSRVVLRPRFNDSAAGGTPVAAPATVAAKQSKPRWEAPAASGMLRARWSNPQLQP